MHILIIDDSKTNRSFFKSILKKEGYGNVLLAESSEEALNQLKTSGKGNASFQIDLILMDELVPDSGGIGLCRQIKKKGRFKDIPVIMVTGKKDSNNLRSAFDAGATDYITKPINEIEFIVRVRCALTLKNEMDKCKNRGQKLLELTRKLNRANQKLRYLSYVDELTNIANRRYFEEFLKSEWLRAKRLGKVLALIMIDIDHFKNYNDMYGHKKGDKCLEQVAQTLSKTLMRPGDFAARFGGEEFVAVLPDTGMDGALRVAEKLRSAVETLNILHKNSPVKGTVTISLGVSFCSPARDSNSDMLINESDIALYQAKDAGRNKIVMYQADMSNKIIAHDS
jgi:diguanylate cyclase (GGDEF)-like protein